MRIDWQKDGAGWRAAFGDYTLYVIPVYTRGLKAARGSKWHGGVSVWCEATRTISRFGRDIYDQHLATAKEAMRLAEDTFNEELERMKAA